MRIAAALLLGLGSMGWAASESSRDLQGRTVDLVLRTEDLAGRVQKLAVHETEAEIHLALPADVLFDFDQAQLRPDAQQALKQAAGFLRSRGRGTIRIEGHTDAKGSALYNQKLSVRRAEGVKRWLIEKEHLQGMKFSTWGFGANRPVAPDTRADGSEDPVGEQQNRRVEIVISK